MSFWATAIVAANSAVTAPTQAMTVGAHVGRVGEHRADAAPSGNTPAVTIVAAWMSAETGVGPAMASGSQRYSGSCGRLADGAEEQQQRDGGGRRRARASAPPAMMLGVVERAERLRR